MRLNALCCLALLGAPAPAAIPVSEVPGRLQQTATIVRRAHSHARPLESITAIEREFPRLKAGSRGLLATTGALLKRQLPPPATRELRSGWAVIGRTLAGWQDTVKKRSGSLQEDIEALRAESEIWRSTLEDAASEQIPMDLRLEVSRAKESIDAAERAVLARRNALLHLLGELSRLGIDLEEMDERLREAMSLGRGKLLVIDAAPLWRPAAKPVDGNDPEGFRFESADAVAAVAKYYVLNLLEFVGFELALFSALAAALAIVRKKARMSGFGMEELERRLSIALRRPFSSALLLTVVTGALWSPAAPEFLRNLGWYAVLVPLCRVLPGLAAPGLAPFTLGLAGLFAAGGAVTFVSVTPVAGRVLVILLAAAAGFSLLAYRRRLIRIVQASGWKQAAETGIRAGVMLLAVAIASETIGATALSRYLTRGVLHGILAAAALYGCFAILRGLVQMGFRAFRSGRDPAWRMPEDLERTMLRGSMWLAVFFYLMLLLKAFQLWDPLMDWTGSLLAYPISFGALSFTIGAACTFLAVLLCAVILSRVLRFIAAGLRERIDLQRGTGEALSKLAHYAILTAGFFVALGASGIDLSKFTVLAGGLGVGVAFGMQNIINNFVSGLILLFERPFHVGDKVTVGATSGEVSDIGIRASVIRTWDGADVIIPNASLILGEVTNWTLSDDRRRGELRIGVAYGTDPAQVIAALTETALSHPQVLRDPAPMVHLVGFGESTLDFILRFWTQLEVHLDAASQIHEAVYRRLREEGIEIPFPQREVHITTANLPEVDSANR